MTSGRWAKPHLPVALNGALALIVLAGCASPYSEIRTGVTGSSGLQEKEEVKIERVVYSHLLEKDSWNSGCYTAVFLKTSDAEVTALRREFPNHVPRIKDSDRLRLYDASSPIDRETGRPAMVLAAIASEPEGDHAQAIGTYFAGAVVSGTYVFQLRKVAGTWEIETVRSAVNL
jgi:hypothetical protein